MLQLKYRINDIHHPAEVILTQHSVHCNLVSSGTQSSDIQMRVSNSSLSRQRFKRYRCESDMPLL